MSWIEFRSSTDKLTYGIQRMAQLDSGQAYSPATISPFKASPNSSIQAVAISKFQPRHRRRRVRAKSSQKTATVSIGLIALAPPKSKRQRTSFTSPASPHQNSYSSARRRTWILGRRLARSICFLVQTVPLQTVGTTRTTCRQRQW